MPHRSKTNPLAKKPCAFIIISLGLFSLTGCGARTDVLVDQVLQKIDRLIGEVEVKREEVRRGIAAKEQALKPLVEGKVRATVEADQMDRKIISTKRSIADAEASLRTLQEYLTAGEPVDLAGKKYSPDELNAQAKKVIQAHAMLTAELDTMQVAHARLLDQANVFRDRHEAAKQRIVDLKSQLTVMDTNRASLKSMRSAREAAGDGGQSLAESFETLEADLNSLDALIQTELAVEDEKWAASNAATTIETAESFINATKPAENTLQEISSILNP